MIWLKKSINIFNQMAENTDLVKTHLSMIARRLRPITRKAKNKKDRLPKEAVSCDAKSDYPIILS